MYRLVICVDVDAKSLHDAYCKVYNTMKLVTENNKDIDWESSDEWYDTDGNNISESEISTVRSNFLKSL